MGQKGKSEQHYHHALIYKEKWPKETCQFLEKEVINACFK